MSASLLFDNVSHSNLLCRFSCMFNRGTSSLVLVAREEDSHQFTRLITGMVRPDSGSINVLGYSTTDSTCDPLIHMRLKIGVVPFSGGLVSNLKVWENIFLPMTYHIGEPTEKDQETARDYLNELGYKSKRMELPAHLSLFEKRVVAFTRAAVMKPEIMLYCNSLEKISTSERNLLLKVMNRFHGEMQERTSIVFASSKDTVDLNGFDNVVSLLQH
ncbi:MAG: ATP-binding cassette domain-containing protein [Geobacteraceae bacterium]|nr:ATP-binding cassette domain-containing protein [Geobacteraceae bacterium]